MSIGFVARAVDLRAILVDRSGLADIVTVFVKIVHIPGDDDTAGVVPGTCADSVPGVYERKARGGCLAKVSTPRNVAAAHRRSQRLAMGIGTCKTAEVAAVTEAHARHEEAHRLLRRILRQDPDVIMIGEIRDYETAQIAIQASLTGHLVLATVHTNDAPSTVTRMIDMGVEPFLLSSSLIGVLAQRLVRKLCPVCKKVDARGRYHPVGCANCGNTGYKGRTGVYELMAVDDQVRALIHGRAAESQIFVAAEAAGLRSMREDGERLVAEGITSAEEVMRVTRE